MLDPDTVLLETEEAMTKALDYLKHELKGIRTGRASPAMVEFVKVDYYGASTDLKAIAAISVPEPHQLLIKPFDPGSIGDIKKGVEAAGLGLNPVVEAKQIRLIIPALTGERRQQLTGRCRKLSEEAKVVMRNARRDGNKHTEGLNKQPGAHFPEDEIDTLKHEIQELLKKYEAEADKLTEAKIKEVNEV